MPLYILANTCILNVVLCLVVVSSVSLDFASTPTPYKVSVLIWPHTPYSSPLTCQYFLLIPVTPWFLFKNVFKKTLIRGNEKPIYNLHIFFFFGKPFTKGWFYLQEKPYTHVSILFNTRIYFCILRIFHVVV